VSAPRQGFEQRTTEICERRGWKWDGKRVELHLDGGRRQEVHLDYFTFDDHEMVRLFSRIGPTRRIRADKLVFALELNWSMAHGSMAVHDEMLVLVDTLMLGDADEAEIEAAVSFLAETADRYEKSMFGPDAY
jgi:hypothetical protein